MGKGGEEMKILLVNGSPHERGSTDRALREVEKGIAESGIKTEIFHIGASIVTGCTECGGCAKSKRCVFTKDRVNMALDIMEQADGYVFGTPVHYAGISGNMKSFMDRVFYAGGSALAYKPGAAVCSCRRAGTTAAYEQLIKYMGINNMPIVSSQYWNMVHGHSAEEVEQDLEGLQIMRVLGRNMGWVVTALNAAKLNGIPMPQPEPKIKTSFIR